MGTESDGKYRIFSFLTNERPDGAKEGDQITLNLVERETGKKYVVTATITYFENVPNGYMFDARTEMDGLPYIMNTYIGHESADFVKMRINAQPEWKVPAR